MSVLIFSDVHLGSFVCQRNKVIELLQTKGENVDEIVIAGDLFDSINCRLSSKDWKILKLLSKLSTYKPVIWVRGNHDEPHPEIIASLLGLTLVNEYTFQSGDKTFFVIHGHVYDNFITNNKLATRIGDNIYFFLQYIDRSGFLARFAKYNSKTFLRCVDKVKSLCLQHHTDCDYIITGHTHHPMMENKFLNCGSFTEHPCTYILVDNGNPVLESV